MSFDHRRACTILKEPNSAVENKTFPQLLGGETIGDFLDPMIILACNDGGI
jgi:hypothetical protein